MYKHFLDVMSCTIRWRGNEVPDKVLPQCEHLVWGKLSNDVSVSPSSTIIMEPSTSKSRPSKRDILVGRAITPMWGDHCGSMKMIMFHLVLHWRTLSCSRAPVPCSVGSRNKSSDQLPLRLTSKKGCQALGWVTHVMPATTQKESLLSWLKNMRSFSPDNHSIVAKRMVQYCTPHSSD